MQLAVPSKWTVIPFVILIGLLIGCGYTWYPNVNLDEVEDCLRIPSLIIDSTRTGAVAGRIVNADTHKPLEFASAYAVSAHRWSRVDSNGAYSLENLFVGTYTVGASCVGYYPACTTGVAVSANDTTWLEFKLYFDPNHIVHRRGEPIPGNRIWID